MPDNKEMLHQFSGEYEDVRFMLIHFIKMLDGVVNKIIIYANNVKSIDVRNSYCCSDQLQCRANDKKGAFHFIGSANGNAL